MINEVLIATNNEGKVRDFEALFLPLGVTVRSLKDMPEYIEIEETGVTFEENAILKAEGAAKLLQMPVIADDSGLEIDALNGEPGVYSARYAGDHDDEANIDKVLSKMKDIPRAERTGRFVCVLAIAGPNIPTQTFEGTCEGSILYDRKGTYGFGYDPIFFVEEKEKSMAELTPEEKGEISHRGVAMRKLENTFNQLL